MSSAWCSWRPRPRPQRRCRVDRALDQASAARARRALGRRQRAHWRASLPRRAGRPPVGSPPRDARPIGVNKKEADAILVASRAGEAARFRQLSATSPCQHHALGAVEHVNPPILLRRRATSKRSKRDWRSTWAKASRRFLGDLGQRACFCESFCEPYETPRGSRWRRRAPAPAPGRRPHPIMVSTAPPRSRRIFLDGSPKRPVRRSCSTALGSSRRRRP